MSSETNHDTPTPTHSISSNILNPPQSASSGFTRNSYHSQQQLQQPQQQSNNWRASTGSSPLNKGTPRVYWSDTGTVDSGADTPSSKDLNTSRLSTIGGPIRSSGSLDGNHLDGSKKLHLSELGTDIDGLDRKPFKDGGNMSSSASKLSKRESLKEKKKTYRSQKKEVAREIMNSASDQAIVLMADWLKVRGTLKGWTKLWCVCKPGMLILYKSEKKKTGHWVGTILLNTCQLLQRPSKKEGYCFKLFHPMDQSIWATKGPKGETIGAFVQPLPMSYLIFRAPSENQGKCWMDGLELALRCTSLIKRTTSKQQDMAMALTPPLSELSRVGALVAGEEDGEGNQSNVTMADDGDDGMEELEGIADEAHYSDDDDHSSIESGSDFELADERETRGHIPRVEESLYIEEQGEELGQQGDACQTEEVNDENKGLIWTLVKQVRPGMDLSKVVLPTFILEPRSFLDKLSDYYYHADLLSQAVQQETALQRMKHVVKWYLSGFYKKPKGLKKPYNPIIGETFRCYWTHPSTKSRTFYVAEQISHHPPVSAFHITNRQDGFNINGCILAKSKFYGNSISAILDGVATLTFLERGEDYFITMPYAHCKGILLGTLTMEMGGKVTINCPKTGYHCDLDFKLKPFFGNGESANRITGRIRMGNEVLCTFEGHWDQQIYIKEVTNREKVLFWDPTPDIRAKRLIRHVVPTDKQFDNESQRLWKKVSEAVVLADMHAATNEKHFLEEKQRSEAKERHKTKTEWTPKWFTFDEIQNKWIYKHVDDRPWDQMTDCVQYEKDYVISTQTVHTIPPKGWKGDNPSLLHHGQVKGYNSSQLDSDSSDANVTEISDDSVRSRHNNQVLSSSDGMAMMHKKVSKSLFDSNKKNNHDETQRKPLTIEHMTSSHASKSQSQPHHNQNGRSFESDLHLQQNTPDNTPTRMVNGCDSPTVAKRVNHNQMTPTRSMALTSDNLFYNQHSSMANTAGGGMHSKTSSGRGSPCSGVNGRTRKDSHENRHVLSNKEFEVILNLAKKQEEMQGYIQELVNSVRILNTNVTASRRYTQNSVDMGRREQNSLFPKSWFLVAAVLILQVLLHFMLSR